MPMSTYLQQKLWESCINDEAANILTRTNEENVKWTCPAWVIPKKKGESGEISYRRVQDCRAINELLTDLHFTMEDANTILSLAKKNMVATSLDFKSAYNLFPIEGDTEAQNLVNPENFAYYHCFKVKETWWKPRGMLFGAKHAPFYFTTIMKPVMKHIRKQWNTDVVIYLDDMLLLHENPAYLEKATAEIANFLLSLGIILSVDKCEPSPKKIIKFLGWERNLQQFTLRMTGERRVELSREIKNWKKRTIREDIVKIRELQEIVGKLQFLKPQISRILLYLRPFYNLIATGIADQGQKGEIRLNRSILGALKWLAKEISFNSPRDLQSHPPQGILTTDASEQGCGATLQVEGEEFLMYAIFNENDRAPETSNQRELLAVLRALQHFQPIIQEKRISTLTLESDNMTTVYNIQKIKSSNCPLRIVRALFSFLAKIKLTLIPIHRPGVDNEKADALSRLELMGDYEVKWEAVQRVLDKWKITPSIDLFATTTNHKLPVYCSANKTDTEAIWIDAWTRPWKDWVYPLIHTTPSLIPKCLQRIQQEGITALMIAPMWPSQPWWDILKRMTIVAEPLGLGKDILLPGSEMKKRKTKLPPGWIELALVTAMKSTENTNEKL
jgi:ribonuclease HI